MKILIAHNRYQHPGGEDAVVKTEYELLKSYGEDVRLYERNNIEIDSLSPGEKLKLLFSYRWSQSSYREFKNIVDEFKPDVVHLHNIFFLLTPSVYAACQERNIPVVHSQHNFRLLCSNGLFFRENHICEECLKHTLWRGVRYGCYKNSRILTALIVAIIDHHWKKGTWLKMVDAFITATEFGKRKFIEGGIPPEKIFVKPNFLYPDPGKREKDEGYALYAGRLSQEKGIELLIGAWKYVSAAPLKVMGDGPLMEKVKNIVKDKKVNNIEFLGFQSKENAARYMKGARFIIIPSLCYESFPRIIAEAFAYGIPVLASELGTMKSLIDDGRTGRLFEPGNERDLAKIAEWMFGYPEVLELMGVNARQEYENKYSAQKNYQFLKNIYNHAIAAKKKVLPS